MGLFLCQQVGDAGAVAWIHNNSIGPSALTPQDCLSRNSLSAKGLA